MRTLILSKASIEDLLSGVLLGMKASGAGDIDQKPLRIDGVPSSLGSIRL